MHYQIRTATADDAEHIAGLFAQLGYEISPDLLKIKVGVLINRKEDQVLVATVDNKPIAVITFHVIPMFHRDNDLGRISSLVVDEQYRHQGIGQQLVKHVTATAITQNCGRMEVTSGDHRPLAHQFYEKLGYQCDERRFIRQLQ